MCPDTKTAFDKQLFVGNREGIPFLTGEIPFGVIRDAVTGKIQIKQAGSPLDTLSKFRCAGILGDIRESNGVQLLLLVPVYSSEAALRFVHSS